MGSFFMSPTYMNDDTADTDIIQFFDEGKPPSVRNTAMLQILLANRPSLMSRPLRVVKPHDHEEEPFLRVLSWNVLAQALGEAVDRFPRDDRTLEWRERRFYFLQEITQYHPDVVCLQEVDHYRFLKASLGSTGYAGEFLKKPESPCLFVRNNNGPDGVALFYDKEKFEWVSWKTRVIEIWGVPTNQVVLGAILRVRSNNVEVFFGVTHLKAMTTPLMAMVRDHQGRDLLKWVEEESGNRPVILCGDFNAEPHEAVYQRIMSHNMNLKSAYCIDGNEPEYTTWKIRSSGEEKKTVDYIFHSDSLTVLQILDLPRPEHVSPKRFPNESYPSDHLSLMVDFTLNTDVGQVEAEDIV